jgi:hypothetical protein
MELTMSQDPYANMTEDEKGHAIAEEQRQYIERTFIGDNLFVGSALDEITPSRGPRTADKHVQGRNEARAEMYRTERDQALGQLAADDIDRRAFELVTTDPSQASEQDRRAAYAYAERHGLLPKETSAEKLVRRVRS